MTVNMTILEQYEPLCIEKIAPPWQTASTNIC